MLSIYSAQLLFTSDIVIQLCGRKQLKVYINLGKKNASIGVSLRRQI